MTTIPASELVQVTPSVLGVGGAAIDVIGLMLTSSAQAPIGRVLDFADAPSVSDYFGASSPEAAKAAIYFGGFLGASAVPASMLVAQYNGSAVGAYLRGGDVSGLTLAQLTAISGSLDVVIDGYPFNAASVNLSSATSFSSAATIIQTALNAADPSEASFTGAISGTVLTVSAVGSGTIAVGQTVLGGGVTAGTIVTSLGSGTGGTGTYNVNHSQSVVSEAMTSEGTPLAVTFDSVSGGFVIASGITGAPSTAAFATGTIAATLMLTSATGAVLSQGAAAAVPAAFMNSLIQTNSDWVTFFTLFDPDGGSGSAAKQAFAAWKNTQNNRFAYVAWDPDLSPAAAVPATSSLGYILANNGDSGTCLIAGDSADVATDDLASIAAFVCGTAAAVNYGQTDGKITFEAKQQSGLAATVTNATAAVNLGGNPQTSGRGNGYNFYGAYGAASSATPPFVWFQRGFATGPFKWLDSYVNQVWLNANLQLALLNLKTNAKSIPYTTKGYSLLEAALADPIAAALNFGAIAPGDISASQAALVNAAAGGVDVATTLQNQGWYVQILPASSSSRAARTTPPATFWYLDRGSVQSINLASVALQ